MSDIIRNPAAPVFEAKATADKSLDAMAETSRTAMNAGLRAIEAGVSASADALPPSSTSPESPRAMADPSAAMVQGVTMMTHMQARFVRVAWDLGRECLDAVYDGIARNVDGLAAITRAGSLPELISAQFDLAQDNVRQASDTAKRIIDRSLAAHDEQQAMVSEAGEQRPAA